MNKETESCLEIEGLTFTYPEQERPVLQEITLSVRQGEFLVLCGPSGCGKSTLLRHLKPVLRPHGRRKGKIFFGRQLLSDLDERTQSEKIGFVFQSPEHQIVTDKVWHELAFGLESLGYDTPTIRRRVAEMASFFGIEQWFYRNVTELSGGQKQLLNLASIMVMQPSILILDEPTGQLDPIAASEFLAALGKINRELGTTILLTEHRLEEAFALASRVIVMDKGKVLCAGTPHDVGMVLKDADHGMFLAMPAPMRIWASVNHDLPCPVNVKEGRSWLEAYAGKVELNALPEKKEHPCAEELTIVAEDLWFKYGKGLTDVVKRLNLTVKKGEFFAVLGGNGTGKTTSLKLLAGLLKPYRGSLQVKGNIGVLPQNPQTLFVKKTIREDLQEVMKRKALEKGEKEEKLAEVTALCRLTDLLLRHPYDLSGGEQQRAALAKVLLLNPEILFLDEPTKGLDAEFKQIFAEILNELLRRGTTIFMVSHDIEFCASHAHRCALFFDGSIVTEDEPRLFFSGNNFYTTAANRMSRQFLSQAVTVEDVVFACGGHVPQAGGRKIRYAAEEASLSALASSATAPSSLGSASALGPGVPPEPGERPGASSRESGQDKLSLPRKLVAGIAAFAAIVLFLQAVGMTDLTTVIQAEGLTALSKGQLQINFSMVAALLIFTLSVGRRSKPPLMVQTSKEKRKLTKRTLIAAVMILILIPLTLFIGVYYLGDRKYYFIALLVMLECMLPFFLVFEARKPQARELVIVAVLCAIAVAGRAALFMLPSFKPVLALTIIAGVAFGGETGFLVGAMSMLVSNIMFSQGPWTPWQMFAMGIIGFLAGLLFRKGLLRRKRESLCVFGALTALVIYGGIMNPASALMWANTINGKILMTYYLAGFPLDCIHGAATAFFLWFAAEPMLEKLDRIKAKYGLME